MKNQLNFKLFLLLFFATIFNSFGNVTPTTTGVKLFCEGSALTLPSAPVGTSWVVKYSATQTATPTVGIVLTGGITVPAANLNTGYYYISTLSSVPGACESGMQEIPVYVLKPLLVDISPSDFCIQGTPTTILGLVTNPETSISTLAYQWYTVLNGTETAISGATTINYTPSVPSTVGVTTYRLKVGYQIGASKYCATISPDKQVTVTPVPTQPTITPGQIIGAGEIVF